MAPLREAKNFVGLHARHMGFPGPYVDRVLERITELDGDGTGSWLREWASEAEAFACRSDHRAAANLYNLARFPCADSPGKRRAAHDAASSLATWLSRTGAGERMCATLDGKTVPFLFAPGSSVRSPLVILMGGIVSLKEQWAGFLRLAPRIGCAIAIADFPGVGENTVRYARGAASLYGAIMDATGDACDATRTLIVAPSFGGHLAMLHALVDARVRSIVTVGAPIAQFFTDPATRAQMPAITRAALCHTAGVGDAELDRHLAGLALEDEELAELAIPVIYIASLRDEIIPEQEWRAAAARTEQIRVYAFDDVHGSPHHLRETRLLIMTALCRHAGRARIARWLDRVGRWMLQLAPVAIPVLPAGAASHASITAISSVSAISSGSSVSPISSSSSSNSSITSISSSGLGALDAA